METATWLDRLLEGKFRSAAASTDVVRTTLTVRDYVHRALCSGFPEPALHLDERSRERWLGAYVDQLVTRDAEGVEEGCDPERLRRHLHALALNSAGVVDDVSLYEAARINKKTAKAYERLLRNLLLVDHHLRAEDGRREIDLVLEVGHNKVIGIEIKSSASPTNDEASHLRWFRDRFGDLVLATVLFHTGPE